MKKIIILCALAASVAGCDNQNKTLPYTPEMASFSNEFDFDPLRGPVKDFTQTLINQKGEVIKRVVGLVSEDGCFNELEFHDLENNTGATLVLNANFYIDAQTNERRVKLQGKCQLAELPQAAVTYDTDDKGFVVAAHGEKTSVVYRYDADGYPLGKTSKSHDETLVITAKMGSDLKKKLDYTSESTLNGKSIATIKQTCDYDSHFNPQECVLNIADQSAKPAKVETYTIKNDINYY
ncbi:MAG TPA: YnfC family lipoprotein [Buttiauxella sp.]|uniref:YnfC family lipoprotein n=1 Tax=Buttiauxella sp. TaxID=1972222 RepID=UPI002B46778E|nr:YnfC family lipoprotein [Buttiauxella sp.]HKM98110.1 YnfC family lipoprotein [Buttiauxella sp.]